MSVDCLRSIADVDAREWNALTLGCAPLLRHEFLSAAEQSGSADVHSGWRPRHLVMRDNDGLRAALPLYEKNHSWGEFVFDWAWANAYARAGIEYYPKLISAVPFTPATTRKLLLRDPNDEAAARELLAAAIDVATDNDCSSLHLHFVDESEVGLLDSAGFSPRKDCQFHWHNEGYTDFDAFLARLSSRKRKNARRDRRHVAEAGVRFRHYRGNEIDTRLWQTVYRLISLTFLRRGSMPYFTAAFFEQLAAQLPDALLVVIAERDSRPIAAAVFIVGDDVLYGRYWGAEYDVNALHFETCYFQGIEFCIENGLRRFEPGTQGEHKVSRGFLPVATWSAHWLAHPQFLAAIDDYVREEAVHVDRYMHAVDSHSPYRRNER